MRQIGSLDDADLAEHFVSFLIISGVDALSETAQRDGKPLYEIWIRDEDGIELARREMQAFLENPQEKKYLDALAEAKQLRKVREKRSKEAASLRRSMPRKSMPSGPGGRRDIGGITLLTGLIALFVTLATNFGSDRARVVRSDMSGEEGGLRLRIKASWTDRLMFVSWVDYKENNNDPLASIKQGEIWRLVTPAFVHMAPMHLLFNCLAMISLGSLCEMLLGRGGYIGLMFVAQLLGSFAQAYAPESLQGSPSFGGLSGIVYGVFGYLWFRPMVQSMMPPLMPPLTIAIMLGWLAVGWLPIGMNVANWTHLGGLIAGVLMAFILPARWGQF